MVCDFDLGGCVCVCTHAAENVQEGKDVSVLDNPWASKLGP